MDRLAEAVAAHLCRHRASACSDSHFDLTRRKLAEVGAVDVVKGVVAPPTPGTETLWIAVAAVREAVCALRERGLVQYVREAEVVNWTGLLTNSTYAPQNCQLRRTALFFAFFSSSFLRGAEEWRVDFTQRCVK
jgi:hypothetical protein